MFKIVILERLSKDDKPSSSTKKIRTSFVEFSDVDKNRERLEELSQQWRQKQFDAGSRKTYTPTTLDSSAWIFGGAGYWQVRWEIIPLAGPVGNSYPAGLELE